MKYGYLCVYLVLMLSVVYLVTATVSPYYPAPSNLFGFRFAIEVSLQRDAVPIFSQPTRLHHTIIRHTQTIFGVILIEGGCCHSKSSNF